MKCYNPSGSNSSEGLYIELLTVKEENLIEDEEIKEEIGNEFQTELIIKEEIVDDTVKEENLVENVSTEHQENNVC